MTEPGQEGTNPVPARSLNNEPHMTPAPPQNPVHVNADMTSFNQSLQNIGQTLASLPDQVVNAFREAIPQQPAQPATDSQPVAQEQSATKTTGPNKFARAWFGLKQ